MFSHPAYGIDLGDGALKAVKLKRRNTRLVVTGADYRPYGRAEDGAVRPVAGLPPRADAALRSFIADARPGPLDRIYVGFPSVATFNRLMLVPDVGPERLQSITDYETHRALRGPVDDYIVRSRVLRRHGQHEEVPCVLFAVRRKLRDAFVSGLSEGGLEFDNLIPSPAALALFARYDRPAKGDRIVLSIGLRGTELVFLRDHGYAFRTLPLGVVGMSAFAVDDVTRRGDAAARLAERITAEIDSASRFFFGKSQPFQPQSLLLLGEGLRFPTLVAELRQRARVPVDEIRSLHRIAIDTSLPAELRARVPEMAQAVGLAIAAARAEHAEIELLPHNRSRDAARRLPGLAAAALCVSGLAWWLTARDRIDADTLRQTRVSPTAAEITAQRANFVSTAASLKQGAAASDALDAFTTARSARSILWSELLKRLGPDVKDYGDSDLRLITARVERAGAGTELSGKVRAAILDLRAASVLRQRLGGIKGLREVEVSEVMEERDEFGEHAVYRFSARITPLGDAEKGPR